MSRSDPVLQAKPSPPDQPLSEKHLSDKSRSGRVSLFQPASQLFKNIHPESLQQKQVLETLGQIKLMF